jgi:predicted nuclease of restriction endonuclease-like RecB superfamily
MKSSGRAAAEPAMLSKEHAIAAFDKGRILPDRLTRRQHGRYLAYAERMLGVYRAGGGRTRQELHRAVEEILAEEPDCPIRRCAAFCRLLDDRSLFDADRRGRAAELRCRVFRAAAVFHPLVERADRLFANAERSVKAAIAAELGQTWFDIDQQLFADLIDFQRLREFPGYERGSDLLARYNVAQVQAALFSAEQMTIRATTDFKTILRYAKLAGLMHDIRRGGEGTYVIRLDGPASVLRETRRYGVRMARFLPALVACRGWRMSAIVRGPRGFVNRLELSDDDGLHSHLPAPEEFDSQVEASFARKWGDEPREGWRLERETEILHRGQKVFLPDFAFRHEDGRTVLLEIAGFWTPEYLQAKAATLELFQGERILIAVSAARQESLPKPLADKGQVISFKSALSIQQVLDRLKA